MSNEVSNRRSSKGKSKYLIKKEMEFLNWDKNKTGFKYPDMVRIRTERDGSCYFHSVSRCILIPYKTQLLDSKPFDRTKYVHSLRKELAYKLSEKKENGSTYYDSLSRGQLKSFSKEDNTVSLDGMRRILLNVNRWIGEECHELMSDLCNTDIYILDYDTHDVYMLSDTDIYYKSRKSIVILYITGHYEAIGLNEEGTIRTLFKPDHYFIEAIRKRIQNIKTHKV